MQWKSGQKVHLHEADIYSCVDFSETSRLPIRAANNASINYGCETDHIKVSVLI